jgi:hypothetical protein
MYVVIPFLAKDRFAIMKIKLDVQVDVFQTLDIPVLVALAHHLYVRRTVGMVN